MSSAVARSGLVGRLFKSRPKTFITSLVILAIVAYVLITLLRTYYFFLKIELALSPPDLPQLTRVENEEFINKTGADGQTSDWFHFASQGTATVPIPYEWFLALEAPQAGPIRSLIDIGSDKAVFIEDFIYRHGFIRGGESAYNPDGLPIGLTKTPSIYLPGIDRHAPTMGFTCAACHTGQFTHNNTRYIVDGGPAVTDLGLFSRSIGAALGQTALSSNFNLLNARFDRFAERVLGKNNNVLTKSKLKDELQSTVTLLKKTSDIIKVTEGFTRNDALNRIGNQVFATDMERPANYSVVNAPVTYPHIWTTSWFDWVQYDGSIMQPLIRNAGEALGVKAYLDTRAPDNQRFASSINMANLHKMEQWLSGTHPLTGESANPQFNGLKSPKWPASLPAPDQKLADEGAKLYKNHCAGCHLPSTDSAEFWSDKHWQPIRYYANDNELLATDEPYLKLKIIKQQDIGTDPGQSQVLTSRRVNTTGLNLDTEVCTIVTFSPGDGQPETTALKYVDLNDSESASYALSLGAVVERTNQQWFSQNYTSPSARTEMQGGRPNCLQAGAGYKARPLNGVWATAPYLHNGSVATLDDLLTPASKRPVFVELGSQEFDVKKVGVRQSAQVEKLNRQVVDGKEKAVGSYYSDDGFFVLDTREAGNHNTGHSFEGPADHDDYARNGVIGPVFTEEQKSALIEYLKTL